MGINFRKSIKVGKNTRINLSKGGGIGISTGVKGQRVSVNKKGIRKTTSIPGTGIYATEQKSWDSKKEKTGKEDSLQGNRERLGFVTRVVLLFEMAWCIVNIVFWGTLLYFMLKFMLKLMIDIVM